MEKNFHNSAVFSLHLAVPALQLGHPKANARLVAELLPSTRGTANSLYLFPELCLTGKTCGDLFFQPLLLDSAEEALASLEELCQEKALYAVLGLPLRLDGLLFNAAALLSPQGLLRFSLQSDPASQGLERWFKPADSFAKLLAPWQGRSVPVSGDASFHLPALMPGLIQLIVGEASPPCVNPSAALLLNPTAAISIASPLEEKPWALRCSENSPAFVASSSAGPWESSTDAVYSGLALLCRNGKTLCQTKPLNFSSQITSCDIKIQPFQVGLSQKNADGISSISPKIRAPFINYSNQNSQFKKILDTQAAALTRRLLQTAQKKVILGISGGSDSSQALLVCLHAFRQLACDPQDIFAVSMPGPGSSLSSKARTQGLVGLAGVTALQIPISAALEAHLKDISHPADLFDTTYENAQARERTQILMDLANQKNALMVGTGDMSEGALGWSTYNGDHMSFYNPNAGLPKTLLLQTLAWAGQYLLGEEGGKAARAVAEAAISPELLPAVDGQTQHSTEEILGPYLVHDYYLYHAVYRHEKPRALFAQACLAFEGLYPPQLLLKWMRIFFKRFLSQQFKRSASADGPQLVEFSLSPRGGLVLPSDASAGLWLQEVDVLEKELSL
ncbi:MAG: NAD(+) synthase [Anaerolineaceae bacterium]|nr:NAD(+) synthase [Anaerolineaceae bacterium]